MREMTADPVLRGRLWTGRIQPLMVLTNWSLTQRRANSAPRLFAAQDCTPILPVLKVVGGVTPARNS
jgi:hypothetical protein